MKTELKRKSLIAEGVGKRNLWKISNGSIYTCKYF